MKMFANVGERGFPMLQPSTCLYSFPSKVKVVPLVTLSRSLLKIGVHMNVVPRSTGNTNSGTRELTLKCKFKCYLNHEYECVVPCFPLLGLTPSGLFMGLRAVFSKDQLRSCKIEKTDFPKLCQNKGLGELVLKI